MTENDHAVVLAAGMGRRLQPRTDDTPKTLLSVGDRPILGHIFAALRANDYRRITMVVGHEAALIRDYCADVSAFEIDYVENERYAGTNNLYSLWLARETLANGFTLVNADTLFSPETVGRLVAAAGPTLVIDQEKSLGDEEMAVAIDGGTVVDIGKELAAADGEYIGLCKFNAESARRLAETLDEFVENGALGEWYERAFAELFGDVSVGCVAPAGSWIEIDDAEDLRAGRELYRTIGADGIDG